MTVAPPSRPHTPYNNAIDGLRAIAVLSVILFHLQANLLPGGYVGVDIFFVISGFVVTASLSNTSFSSLGELLRFFYARRLFRIMPALLTVLVITTALSAMFIPDAWLSDSIYRVGQTAFLGLSNVALAIQTDSYFAPRAGFNPFLHTWSLGVEEQFYLFFPFVMWIKLRQGGKNTADRAETFIIVSLSAASLITCAILTYVAWRYAFYSILGRFWELGTGMVLSLTIDRWRPVISAVKRPATTAMAIAGFLLLLLSLGTAESTLFPFPMAVLPVCATALLIVLVTAKPKSQLAQALSTSAPVQCGKLSYSLYLWHWPVFVLMRWTCGLDGPTLTALALGAVVSLSWLSYRFIEQPMRRLAATLSRTSPGKLIAVALATTALAAAGSHVVIKHRVRLSLSVTKNRAVWQPDEVRRLFPSSARCQFQQSEGALTSGSVTTWTPVKCPRSPRRRLYLVGDSHSLAMRPLALQYASEQGLTVRSAFLSGCNFVQLSEPLAARPECLAFINGVVDWLRGEAKPGDIIFMPSLRVSRLQDEAGRASVGRLPVPSTRDRAIALTEARRILKLLSATGARLVIEAPLPVFRSAPFRCSDWFNRMNPECEQGATVPADLMKSMRAPVLQAAGTLAHSIPALSVWDPFPVLCPGVICNSFQNGQPLFFDGDHLSNFGNWVLYRSFADHLHTASHAGPAPIQNGPFIGPLSER